MNKNYKKIQKQIDDLEKQLEPVKITYLGEYDGIQINPIMYLPKENCFEVFVGNACAKRSVKDMEKVANDILEFIKELKQENL